MPYLDSALAFAFTMLIVATLVTKIVDFLQWLSRHFPEIVKGWLGERCKIFRKMADEFVATEMCVIVAREAKITRDQAEAYCANAISKITAEVGAGKPLAGLSNADLLDKLKQTEVGKTLISGVGPRAAEVFGEISRRYAAIEKKYTEIFRTKARVVGSIVAAALALCFNIDSISVFRAYHSDSVLAAKVTAKIKQTTDSHKALVSKIESTEGKVAAEQLKAKYSELEAQLAKLNAKDFPIGPAYYPWGTAPAKSPSILLWLLGIAVTVYCAGLGAPFWHDAIRSLNQMARGKNQSSNPPHAAGE